jgi:hypothetical protein
VAQRARVVTGTRRRLCQACPVTESLPERIVLRDFPVQLWARQQAYYDELLREFKLLIIGREQGEVTSAPARLVELADSLNERFGAMLDAVATERQAAYDAGLRVIDSELPVVPGTTDIVRGVQRVFAEVDEFCRRGDLLTLAMPADLAALRDWSTEEILRQCAGWPPTPWPGPTA